MSLLTILDVVLGLIFMWLVISLAVISIQEWLAAKLHWRSKMLENTIRNMLVDPALADQFYNHPLIRSLYSGKNSHDKPAYIPSSQFALVLFDIVINAGTEASLLQQQLYKLRWGSAALRKRRRKVAQKRLNLILALARRALVSSAGEVTDVIAINDVKVEIEKLAKDFPALRSAAEDLLGYVRIQKEQIDEVLAEVQRQKGGYIRETTLDNIRIGVASLGVTHPRLKQTIYALINGVEEYAWQGESALARARKNVEDWYESSMDRLSGWYKRRAQVLAFMVGMMLAVFSNTDSLLLATQLWREPVLRNILSIQANLLASQNANNIQPSVAGEILFLQDLSVRINLPIGWIGSPVSFEEGANKCTCTLFPQIEEDIYGLPVANRCYPVINSPPLNDLTGWILKIIGLLTTSLAAAQGAPFWFDILKKMINIRSSGANPSEAQEPVG